MASYTVARAKTATLSGSTVDQVTINGVGQIHAVDILNRSTSVGMNVNLSLSSTAPTAPTVDGDNFPYVGPGGSITVPLAQAATNTVVVSIIGNGNVYTVQALGVPW